MDGRTAEGARHDRGLSTGIGETWEASGRLPDQKRRQLNRLPREHRRSKHRSRREKNQMHGIFEVRHVADGMDLGGEVREQTCQLFRTAQQQDLLRGRSIESFGAAVVYAVVRTNALPRTEAEVAEAARCTAEAFRNAYHVLNRELDLRLRRSARGSSSPSSPRQWRRPNECASERPSSPRRPPTVD